MIEKIGYVRNPLTIIAVFAGLAEVSGTIILPLLEIKTQAVYVWFLMIFPVFLVFLFFITLNLKHHVLYAPSDYKNDDTFINAMTEKESRSRVRQIQEDLKISNDATEYEKNNLDEEKQNKNVSENPETDRDSIINNLFQGPDSIARALLSEELTLMKISKNLDLKIEKSRETYSSRELIFDGVAKSNTKIYGIISKYSKRNKIPTPLIKRDIEKVIDHYKKLSNHDQLRFSLIYAITFENLESATTMSIAQEILKYITEFNIDINVQFYGMKELEREFLE